MGWEEKDESNCLDQNGLFLNGHEDYTFSDNDRDYKLM